MQAGDLQFLSPYCLASFGGSFIVAKAAAVLQGWTQKHTEPSAKPPSEFKSDSRANFVLLLPPETISQ